MHIWTKITGVLGSVLMLSACNTIYQTNYEQSVAPSQAAGWRFAGADVLVPKTLSVSEANTYAPDVDIVWREEPYGDRYAQVQRIIEDAVTRGGSSLRGNRPVKLNVVVSQFHALTELTRYTLSSSGVHNIDFTISVLDARTGEVLAGPEAVQADLIAYVGDQARVAVANGQTQRVRIVDHVAKTVAGWLSVGPDNRGTFTRRGR